MPCGPPTIQATAAEISTKARTPNRPAMLDAMTSRPPVPSVSDTVTRSPMNGSRSMTAPARSATAATGTAIAPTAVNVPGWRR